MSYGTCLPCGVVEVIVTPDNSFHVATLHHQASMSKRVKGAEKAFVKLALSYDRFMKAGNILPM